MSWSMVIGKHNPQVLDLAGAYGIADRLWQTGFIPDDQVGGYLACADVMRLPMEDRAANRGRLPNKLLDYLAAGRPVVASPVGDIKTIMETHRVGLLADPPGFAAVFQTLFTDDALRYELSDTARRVAEAAFGRPALIDQLEALTSGSWLDKDIDVAPCPIGVDRARPILCGMPIRRPIAYLRSSSRYRIGRWSVSSRLRTTRRSSSGDHRQRVGTGLSPTSNYRAMDGGSTDETLTISARPERRPAFLLAQRPGRRAERRH